MIIGRVYCLRALDQSMLPWLNLASEPERLLLYCRVHSAQLVHGMAAARILSSNVSVFLSCANDLPPKDGIECCWLPLTAGAKASFS
jgi:hypothetical protein